MVSEMFMKNVKWWKVRTFPVFTSWTFIWTGLHHPCLPGISPISPIVWRTNASPVNVGVMVSGDGLGLTGWSDGPGVWVCLPGVAADSQCLGIHCEAEKSLCPCPWVCATWNHQVSHPCKLQFGKCSANTVHTCMGTWLPTMSRMCIQTQFSDWFSSKIPILNTARSQPGAQFRGPFSIFQSFLSGNELLKWTKAAVIHICA